MKKFIYGHKADILLFFTFLVFVAIIQYCYPIGEITWDSDSYIQVSKNILPNTRPIGYPVFLRILYMFSHSISLVVYSQYIIYFFSILCLLKIVNRYKRFTSFQYYLLGVLLLVEPASLYNCITILSDIIFAAFTYFYLATLLLYINNRKPVVLVAHIIVLVCCIETRHIALFFPLFTIITFVVYLKNIKLILIDTCAILLVFYTVYVSNVNWNNKVYGVSVYSPFSGWTEANNALYALPIIKLNPKYIQDPEIRELHTFFTAYLDTTTFIPNEVGPGYLWDQRSPLNVLRKQVDDSLIKRNGNGDYTLTWYLLAPRYAKYGSFIERKFPYEYITGFILPNFGTLIKPHDGEMEDYYTAKGQISSASLQRYNLTANKLYCRKQLYKDHINSINLFLYQSRLLLFLLSIPCLFIFRKYNNTGTNKMLILLIAFTGLFYISMLCSSWFMPRYLLPVLPLLTIVIFITVISFINRSKPTMPQT